MVGICAELWTTITGELLRNAIVALQEVKSWSIHRQEHHTHSLIKGKSSDCGIIVPNATMKFICFTAFHERYCIVQIQNILIISVHLVRWNKTGNPVLDLLQEIISLVNLRKAIWENQSSLPLDAILCIDANTSVPADRWAERDENGELGELTWRITGGAVLPPKNHNRPAHREAFLSFLEALDMYAVNTFENPATTAKN